MILDVLEQWPRYAAGSAALAAGFRWLAAADVARLAPGRHAIDGERVYALHIAEPGKTRGGARLETHRRYLDIQYTASGGEVIGWRAAAACRGGQGYDAARDIEFYADAPLQWIEVPAGHFAVFFPDDAHAPMAVDGPVHKVVVKVALP